MSLDLQLNSLIKEICSDIVGCEFKWTLFVSAAFSYKHDSLLRPFPSQFVVNNVLDIERVRQIIDTVPPFNDLLHTMFDWLSTPAIFDEDNYDVDYDMVDLVYWCLVQSNAPTLKSVERNNVSKHIFISFYFQIKIIFCCAPFKIVHRFHMVYYYNNNISRSSTHTTTTNKQKERKKYLHSFGRYLEFSAPSIHTAQIPIVLPS